VEYFTLESLAFSDFPFLFSVLLCILFFENRQRDGSISQTAKLVGLFSAIRSQYNALT